MNTFAYKVLGGIVGGVIGTLVSFLIGGLDQSVFIVAIIGIYVGYSGVGVASEPDEAENTS